MEDLWNVKDVLSQKKCVFGLQKATKIMLDLFKWLDRDGDKYITPEDMIYGISRILVRDVNVKEVKLIIFELSFLGERCLYNL
jgi:Ca2+-binding EF-hand superfamily protein